MNSVLRMLAALLGIVLVLAMSVVLLPVGLLLLGLHLVLGNFRGAKKLQDPVFGVMTYDWGGTWIADHDHEFPVLGGSFALHVAASRGTVPGAVERATFQALVRNQADIRRQVEAVLYRDYQTLAPEVREELAPLLPPAELEKTVPRLQTPAEIWRLLGPGAVFIGPAPDQFTISWSCTWDEEHGVYMEFEQGKLIDEG